MKVGVKWLVRRKLEWIFSMAVSRIVCKKREKKKQVAWYNREKTVRFLRKLAFWGGINTMVMNLICN
jgi:hypothetical protein